MSETRLWKVTVERTQEAVLFVEAESAEDAAKRVRREAPIDWRSMLADEVEHADSRPVQSPTADEGRQTVLAADPFAVEQTVDEWLVAKAGEEAVGSAPYRRLVEAAGQLSFLGRTA